MMSYFRTAASLMILGLGVRAAIEPGGETSVAIDSSRPKSAKITVPQAQPLFESPSDLTDELPVLESLAEISTPRDWKIQRDWKVEAGRRETVVTGRPGVFATEEHIGSSLRVPVLDPFVSAVDEHPIFPLEEAALSLKPWRIPQLPESDDDSNDPEIAAVVAVEADSATSASTERLDEEWFASSVDEDFENSEDILLVAATGGTMQSSGQSSGNDFSFMPAGLEIPAPSLDWHPIPLEDQPPLPPLPESVGEQVFPVANMPELEEVSHQQLFAQRDGITDEMLVPPPSPEPKLTEPRLEQQKIEPQKSKREPPKQFRKRLPARLDRLNKSMSEITIQPEAEQNSEPFDLAREAAQAYPKIVVKPEGWVDARPDRYPVPMFYQPLYFEDPNLERCGRGHGGYQTLCSAGQFLSEAVLLPFSLVAIHPTTIIQSPGDCRSGGEMPSFPSYQYDTKQVIKGSAVEAIAVVGAIFLML